MIQVGTESLVRQSASASDGRPALREAARAMEAMFLAEMLGEAGLGKASEAFGGGPGEEAFGSFLTQEQARLLSERGGIGLAERLFEAMVRRQDQA